MLTELYRCLRRHALIELRRRRKRREKYRRWERDRPMQLWQMDVMGGVLLDDGTELKVLTGIDDHSRFCVVAGLMRRAISKAVCEIFGASLRRYGIPDEVLTDNGKCFTGRFGPQPVEVMFDRICRENGISHRHTGVRSPTTTGKIERFHQSLRREFLADRTFPLDGGRTGSPGRLGHRAGDTIAEVCRRRGSQGRPSTATGDGTRPRAFRGWTLGPVPGFPLTS
jgi:transposase InsO family protein